MSRKFPRPGVHRALSLRFSAPISKSMAQALLAAFEGRDENDPLLLESREFGLWVIDESSGTRMFIGSTSEAAKNAKH